MRDFEAYQVMIAVRRVALVRHFEDVEAKLRFSVSERILLVRNSIAIFFLKSGVEERYGAICGEAMAVVVGRIMG